MLLITFTLSQGTITKNKEKGTFRSPFLVLSLPTPRYYWMKRVYACGITPPYEDATPAFV